MALAASVGQSALARREAFDLAELGRAREAHDALQAVIGQTDDARERGWLKQQAAAYLHPADGVQAQRLQLSAQSDNRALLKPRAGVEYERLRGTADQATRASEFLSQKYADEMTFQLGAQAVLDDLIPGSDPAAVERFEQATHDLGEHLGFEVQRPERETGVGPDVLWKIGDLTFLVIECKSGVTTDFIAKNDAAQLSAAIDWFESKYDATWCEAVPVMIHKSAKLHAAANPRGGMRVITFDRLNELREAVGKFARALASQGAYKDSKRITEQLQALELAGKAFVNRWTTDPAR